MGLVIALVVVVILVGGFIIYLVLNATKKRGPDTGMGTDASPLGDTTEHAGEQSREGETVGRQDADEAGGTGRPVQSGPAETSAAGHDPADPDAAAHGARPGEGEGRERLDFEGEHPARERS
jgi:hypothetical protein